MIFTRVEGLLREAPGGRCEIPRDALTAILAANVPLVLVSESNAAEVRRLLLELDLRQPFICDGGASLHIPPAYFADGDDDTPDGEWERFSFTTRGPAAAIRLLIAMFGASRDGNLLTVGLGCHHHDSTMLENMDIPIVVRSSHADQQLLLQYVPGAYLTQASGAAGWLEAIVGPGMC